MKSLLPILTIALACFVTSCTNDIPKEKGFQVSHASENERTEQTEDLNEDSLKFATRPSSVLVTGLQDVKLTTIYKVNYRQVKKSGKEIKIPFIGSNEFHYRYEDTSTNDGNNWNNHLMPGIEALYGYNLVNISHYNIKEDRQKYFFDSPVLIRTLYYPTDKADTLNHKPIFRDYFMVTVYNDDTNKDGHVNMKDLRRMYLFDAKGEMQKALVPENYSIFKSEYDPKSDVMYVFARLDANENGQEDDNEPIHVFWIDLKKPERTGRLY